MTTPVMDPATSAVAAAARSLMERFTPLLDEALTLRGEVSLPREDMSPSDLQQLLHDVRSRLDRVEHILTTAIRIKGRASRATTRITAELEDAWDAASREGRARPAAVRGRGNDDFVAPRERYADNNLATLPMKRAARDAAETLSVAEECLEVLRIAHRGLDGLRRDVDAVLQAQRVERSIER